jgi:multidrug efflux system membrane fusion protein
MEHARMRVEFEVVAHRRIGAVLALVMTAAFLAGCGDAAKRRTPRAAVTVAHAVERDAPYTLAASGTVEARHSATLNCQVGGVLESVLFQEGHEVAEGQALFHIDSRPFAAALEQARGVLARDRAQAVTARAVAERSRALAEQKVVSQQELETSLAQAEALEAGVRADSAAVMNARLNLEYCTVRAPISGRTGRVLAHVGDLMKANTTDMPLVVINELRPILVRFAVPQSELPMIMRHREEHPRVRVTRPGADSTAIEGHLTFVDNQVDAGTGTVLLKAEFPNRDGALWPGAFVNVNLDLFVEKRACVVPSTAVVNSQSGTFVYAVGADSTANMKPVRVGRSFGDMSVITSGLEPGDLVVTDGQLRLIPGSSVYWKEPAASAASHAP